MRGHDNMRLQRRNGDDMSAGLGRGRLLSGGMVSTSANACNPHCTARLQEEGIYVPALRDVICLGLRLSLASQSPSEGLAYWGMYYNS